MIRKYAIHFVCTIFGLLASLANAQVMPPDMRFLCGKATASAFVPLPESIRAPHFDPLFNAIEMGEGHQAIKTLLKSRNPDKIVIDGLTPLLAAAYVGNWPAAEALIESGADVNFKGPDVLETPLVAALFRSKYSMACKLIEKKASLPTEKADRDSLIAEARVSTPDLHSDAAVFVNFLLENGFDANDQGSKTQTPLMGAVSLSNIPLIKVLLKHGARLDTVKKNGLTVWDVARKKNNPEVLKILNDAQKKADAAKKHGVQELQIR